MRNQQWIVPTSLSAKGLGPLPCGGQGSILGSCGLKKFG